MIAEALDYRCERCGRSICIDKRFVPDRLLYAARGIHDCPRFYGPKPAPGPAPYQRAPSNEIEKTEEAAR